jgi:UDP-N-acetylmuramyl pentapeptide phosphotransferase/UDP-N-acetylglucosamine-1-phosphate transferase
VSASREERGALARLRVANHRGVAVPRTLGFALVGGALIASLAVATAREVPSRGWCGLAALAITAAAGLVDDLGAAGPRGVRNHLRALVGGRVTTGVVKAVVIGGASVVTAALRPPEPAIERVAAAVVLAACANVWNGLDVRPGRALKAFVPVGIAFLALARLEAQPAVLGVLVAALAVLPLDLRERAMLGDSGSNALGFAAGLALLEVLPGGWIVVAAIVAVALNALAETLTFSRVIEATPPLRWVDGLGRRR